jgi:hypothetical protein
MAEVPGFGAKVVRLLERRGVGVRAPADAAGVSTDVVQSVVGGRTPSEEVLRQLAPALGLHAVDLFILAGLEVPDDLAPLDHEAEPWVSNFVLDAMGRLPGAQRLEILHLIRTLPQEERAARFAPRRLALPSDGSGNHVVRMLSYRNLSWMGMAKILATLTPTYLSAATYGVIGSDREELTPRLVMDFAAVLGIDARDLAALTDVALPHAPPPPTPEAAHAATLLWEARRLSAAQARHVADLTRSLR